ncbi:serine protease inhibitor Kazal-type 1-like [Hypomesus transpacificus]|uniref:serine protease inhibitor Kazal-type 1-like n=1 Tax=Hypomesus transpacificus TaxID=137520 RepID=UPI001F07F0E2|nr:serine protease inhibitor Kazal-type 1-like [Hypomesus transpacificus]
MRTLPRLILAFLCVAVAVHGANLLPGEGEQADCAQFSLPMCPRNYEPVCGSDGVTYANECMLCFNNSERKVNVLIRSKEAC